MCELCTPFHFVLRTEHKTHYSNWNWCSGDQNIQLLNLFVFVLVKFCDIRFDYTNWDDNCT